MWHRPMHPIELYMKPNPLNTRSYRKMYSISRLARYYILYKTVQNVSVRHRIDTAVGSEAVTGVRNRRLDLHHGVRT